MNGFRYISENIRTRLESKSTIYALLISSIYPKDPNDSTVYSAFPYSRIEALGKYETELQELQNEGFIQEVESDGDFWYVLGKWEGKRPVYLPDLQEVDVSAFAHQIKEMLDSAIAASGRIHKPLYRGLADKLSPVMAGKLPNNSPGFVELFNVLCQVYFMEPPREAMQKEYGQMKTLLKLYPSAKLVQMIVFYLINSEKYGSAFPSIGGLLYHKDDIVGKIIKRTVKSDDDLSYG